MTDPRIDLIALDMQLGEVGPPRKPGAHRALPISSESESRLLHNPDGRVSLLIVGGECAAGAGLKLRNIEATGSVQCEIEAPDGASQNLQGVLISCKSHDPQLRRLFLTLMEEAIAALGASPSAAAIAAWINRLATLFARLEREGRKRMRGLWAELIFILALEDKQLGARRWHANPKETFDFMAGSFAIEVKSCLDFERVHHFSLKQLQPPSDVEVHVASIVTRADPLGTSVLELAAEIERGITNPAILADFRAMVFEIGGEGLEDDDMFRFDRIGALQTLRLIGITDVPSIEEKLAEEILSVELTIRCSAVPETIRLSDVAALFASSLGS
ncbi:MAG: PD-(D/E)XK motif protein [Sphingopyxis sp.]|uniref:PD-(D/E)XK motif protein n=1 Tax=Sphingopyxis sp. TaxID=1908224 RepID=UPI001A20CD48|nr:PD-(D/E)XK motif protein [Sphingopyxis sp.]MBJ7498273.1 PD-(D/E)XK motif protein [Sphingopyxis sp.]